MPFQEIEESECGRVSAQQIDVWILGKFFERILTKYSNGENNCPKVDEIRTIALKRLIGEMIGDRNERICLKRFQ